METLYRLIEDILETNLGLFGDFEHSFENAILPINTSSYGQAIIPLACYSLLLRVGNPKSEYTETGLSSTNNAKLQKKNEHLITQ